MRKGYSCLWPNADFQLINSARGSEGHLTDMTDAPIDAGVRIGHVHLKVSDLERALEFYSGVLGFQLM